MLLRRKRNPELLWENTVMINKSSYLYSFLSSSIFGNWFPLRYRTERISIKEMHSCRFCFSTDQNIFIFYGNTVWSMTDEGVNYTLPCQAITVHLYLRIPGLLLRDFVVQVIIQLEHNIIHVIIQLDWRWCLSCSLSHNTWNCPSMIKDVKMWSRGRSSFLSCFWSWYCTFCLIMCIS